MLRLQLRHGGFFWITVACLLTLVAASKSSVFALANSENDEFRANPQDPIKGSGESSGGSTVLRGLHDFSCRVFKLVTEQEDWPKFEFGWRTGFALILGAMGAALSSAGGLGGGGLFVPLFNLLLQFDAKTSAALSNFMILGGSLANLYINLQQRHPSHHHKPLIDFDVLLMLQPNMLLGISSGVILNVILPDWMITAFLTVTLVYMTVHSFEGGLRRWKKETSQNRLRKSSGQQNAAVPYVIAPDFHHDDSSGDCSCESNDDDDNSLTITADSVVATDHKGNDEENWKDTDSHNASFSQKRTVANGSEGGALSEPFLRKDSSPLKSSCFPKEKVLALLFTWFAFFAIQILRGGKGNQGLLGIEPCGWGFWLLTATQIPLAFGVTAWTVHRLRASHVSSLGPDFVQEDGFVLTPDSCAFLGSMALAAGLLGGLLGIGGGTIINPFLLTIGMIPQVTAGTCASMVFFSSSMSVVQFLIMGRVPLEFALSAAVLCATFSIIGVAVVHRVINKYNRASIIVFSVTTVMGVSAILMAGFGGYGVWKRYTAGAYMGFHNYC